MIKKLWRKYLNWNYNQVKEHPEAYMPIIITFGAFAVVIGLILMLGKKLIAGENE